MIEKKSNRQHETATGLGRLGVLVHLDIYQVSEDIHQPIIVGVAVQVCPVSSSNLHERARLRLNS